MDDTWPVKAAHKRAFLSIAPGRGAGGVEFEEETGFLPVLPKQEGLMDTHLYLIQGCPGAKTSSRLTLIAVEMAICDDIDVNFTAPGEGSVEMARCGSLRGGAGTTTLR